VNYELNSTEQLYIDKCVEVLQQHGLGQLLESTVASIAIHAYQAGVDYANPY